MLWKTNADVLKWNKKNDYDKTVQIFTLLKIS